MAALTETSRLFYDRCALAPERVRKQVGDALASSDDGELYLEYRQTESLVWDDGRLRSANFDTSQGFGLRAVAGEAVGYAHAGEISEAAIGRAAGTVRQVAQGHHGQLAVGPQHTNQQLYPDLNPLTDPGFGEKVKLLESIDSYARSLDSRVAQVTAVLAGQWQAVHIVRGDGHEVADIRPLVRLTVNIVAAQGERRESGVSGSGGRQAYSIVTDPAVWRWHAEEALRQALVNLEAGPAPAGEMPVVLGSGWPGILLHEAIGHGLEGDFNRKKTSAFAGLLGEKIADESVTVVDDGTLDRRRGSLTVDDEGTPTQCNTLIENGRLTKYMQDRLNARLMGVPATGNGRRESHAYAPMPRMTNTFMLAGEHDPAELTQGVDRGLYAVNFGGGQVDITSGKFVFEANEAYLIENGRITRPVKGAMLIGNGPDALTEIRKVANDPAIDRGMGNCGKQGQWVPVGVGQPSLRIDSLTVGGTEA